MLYVGSQVVDIDPQRESLVKAVLPGVGLEKAPVCDAEEHCKRQLAGIVGEVPGNVDVTAHSWRVGVDVDHDVPRPDVVVSHSRVSADIEEWLEMQPEAAGFGDESMRNCAALLSLIENRVEARQPEVGPRAHALFLR